MTRAEAFSDREVAMCQVARLVEDGRTYWAAGGGTPLYSVLLGKKLYAPEAQYITEDGVIAPEPMLPFEPMMTMVASRAVYRALAWGTMNSAGIHAQLGYMDYGVLNTLQVDQHGNINSTFLGEYGGAGRRFGGPGGADTIAACCWRTILITDQERRKFVREVDFIQRYVFPGGMLPSPQVLKSLGEKFGVPVIRERIFGEDYAKTLATWRDNFRAAWPSLTPLGFDERFRRLWEYYLAYCEAGFLSGNIDVRQVVFAKTG